VRSALTDAGVAIRPMHETIRHVPAG
jgi:hypothetical protein